MLRRAQHERESLCGTRLSAHPEPVEGRAESHLQRAVSSNTTTIFTVLALLAAIGCGSGGDDDAPSIAVPFELATAGIPAFGDIPWPSDLYRDADGTVEPLDGLERLVARPQLLRRELSALDGFGRSTGALFFVTPDTDVEPATLPSNWDDANAADASVLLVDVDPMSAHFGERYPVQAKYLPTLNCLSVIPVPGVVVAPGVRYAAVLTSRVRTRGGERLTAADALADIIALPAQRRVTRAALLYGDAADALVASGAVRRRSDIAALAVFTTSDRVFEMADLRRQLFLQPEPVLLLDPAAADPYTVAVFARDTDPSLRDWLGDPEKDETGRDWPGSDNPGGIAHDAIGVVASGAFVAPSFLRPRGGGGFATDPDSGAAVITRPDALVPVTLVLPLQPAPASGYPVVIHGHGLSNHRGSMFGVANELARAGFAMIAIDDVLHGSRQGIGDIQNNFAGSYDGPDGIPDSVGLPIAFFAGFADFVAIRDNFRQTVLDHVSLVRLLRSSRLDLTPLATPGALAPTLDSDRIYWSGGSLGGIMGTMVLAVEPEIRAAALQVPGASFLQLITTGSAELAPLVSGLTTGLLGILGGEAIDAMHPVANLLAAVTEPGDPIAYAPHVGRDPLSPERLPPDVLLSYAVYDEVLPNVATVALVRALGLDLARPRVFDLPGIRTVAAPVVGNLANGRTGAAVQYLPANHGLGYARYDTRKFFPSDLVDGAFRPRLAKEFRFEQPIREHTAQLVGFFSSAATGSPARIDVTAPPRADYDGDGVLDEEEGERGTDPYDPDSH